VGSFPVLLVLLALVLKGLEVVKRMGRRKGMVMGKGRVWARGSDCGLTRCVSTSGIWRREGGSWGR
jgi:hypothetical protein